MNHALTLSQGAPEDDGVAGELRSLEHYARYRQPVLRYLCQLCGSPEQAEELTQEPLSARTLAC